MKIDGSNKRYTYIITGILILPAAVAIFGAFALGVMGLISSQIKVSNL